MTSHAVIYIKCEVMCPHFSIAFQVLNVGLENCKSYTHPFKMVGLDPAGLQV